MDSVYEDFSHLLKKEAIQARISLRVGHPGNVGVERGVPVGYPDSVDVDVIMTTLEEVAFPVAGSVDVDVIMTIALDVTFPAEFVDG